MREPFAHRAEVNKLQNDADHIDTRTIASEKSLREFLFGMFNHAPLWMKALMGIRMAFAKLLGISGASQEDILTSQVKSPDTLRLEEGEHLTFFQTKASDQETFWLGGITESHLTAHLAVEMERMEDGTNHFHVATLVHYHSWTGPIYFNAIRPFHHLVLWSMMRAGAGNPKAPNAIQMYSGIVWMMIATFHNIIGLLLFTEPLLAIGKAGGWNAIGRHWDRNTAFWFLFWGIALFLLGAAIQWMLHRVGRTPDFLAWSMLGMCALGVFFMPVSGFWLGFPVALGMLQMNRAETVSPFLVEA